MLPRIPRLTLFGRSLLLVSAELAANALCWVGAGILFSRHEENRSILGLALLAWTIGLRHALDADHISAIDNATRGLLALGQLPVTCGLYFSLGHSTIVVIANVAIAISSNLYDKIGRAGRVGGIIGPAVSSAFLFIIGSANAILLWRIIKRRRREEKRRSQRLEASEYPRQDSGNTHQMLWMRIFGPVLNFVNRPWKMYLVGFLFGLGFDTASSIALLAVSVIAKKGSDGRPIPPAHVVILPLLFTAAMTLVDSLDSILMLYSYAGFPERTFAIFERSSTSTLDSSTRTTENLPQQPSTIAATALEVPGYIPCTEGGRDRNTRLPQDSIEITTRPMDISGEVHAEVRADNDVDRHLLVKNNAMSGLSIILTFMSILVAFSISLITVMGLIGDNCNRCKRAAEAGEGGGFEGQWWRAWAAANNQSGLIGAGIVGSFVFVVGIWYGIRWIYRRWKLVLNE